MRECKPSTNDLDYMGECALGLHKHSSLCTGLEYKRVLVSRDSRKQSLVDNVGHTHTYPLTLSHYFHKVTHTFIYIHIHVHTETHLHSYKHIHMLTLTHSHTHVHAHRDTHSHKHACTHTHLRIDHFF